MASPASVSPRSRSVIGCPRPDRQKNLPTLQALAGIGQSWHPSVTVEICSQAHMIDAHYPDGVLKMLDSVEDAGLIIKAEETWVERNLADAALLGQCPHLVIGEVARMIA